MRFQEKIMCLDNRDMSERLLCSTTIWVILNLLHVLELIATESACITLSSLSLHLLQSYIKANK